MINKLYIFVYLKSEWFGHHKKYSHYIMLNYDVGRDILRLVGTEKVLEKWKRYYYKMFFSKIYLISSNNYYAYSTFLILICRFTQTLDQSIKTKKLKKNLCWKKLPSRIFNLCRNQGNNIYHTIFKHQLY